MTYSEMIQILAGGVGVIGFCVLFNIRGKRLIATAIGGFFSWTLFVLLSYLTHNEPINYFIVALSVSIYAEIMARVLKTPTTVFITTALVPLIPGGSLYYTMASAFESNLDRFVEKAVYTFQLGAALALGIIVATTLTKLIQKLLSSKKERRKHNDGSQKITRADDR